MNNIKVNKEMILRNLITILCVFCILALCFTYLNVSSKVSSEYVGDQSTSTGVSGFRALATSFFGWFLILGPALLVAMNYFKQLDKFKGILSIIVPIICIISMLIILGTGKGAAKAGADAVNAVADAAGEETGTGVKVSSSPAFGFFFLLLLNIGIIVDGFVTFFGLNLKDASSFKQAGMNFVGSAKDTVNNVSGGIRNTAANMSNSANRKNGTMTIPTGPAVPAAPAAPVAHAPAAPVAPRVPSALAPAAPAAPAAPTDPESVLALIERLAQMKKDGVLTEEEFAEKKQELLKKI